MRDLLPDPIQRLTDVIQEVPRFSRLLSISVTPSKTIPAIIRVNPVSETPTQIDVMKKITPKNTKPNPRAWNAYFSNFYP